MKWAMFSLALIADGPVRSPQQEVANWACADPLVERNYRRNIDAEQLALRIADECARPFAGHRHQSTASMEETTYLYRLGAFRLEIQGKIETARRRAAIPLD